MKNSNSRDYISRSSKKKDSLSPELQNVGGNNLFINPEEMDEVRSRTMRIDQK